jgi:hypothetical protein
LYSLQYFFGFKKIKKNDELMTKYHQPNSNSGFTRHHFVIMSSLLKFSHHFLSSFYFLMTK